MSAVFDLGASVGLALATESSESSDTALLTAAAVVATELAPTAVLVTEKSKGGVADPVGQQEGRDDVDQGMPQAHSKYVG